MDERPICPKCHLPVQDEQDWIWREGKRYHRHCAPPPEESDKANVPEGGPISI